MFRYSLSAQRRLFAVSEPYLLATKMSEKDFAYKVCINKTKKYNMQNPPYERCNGIYLRLTDIASLCDRRTVPMSHPM